MKPITGKASLSVLLGAAFLMATSSIGPGFMLQTAAFTGQLQAAWLLRSVLDFPWRPCVQYRQHWGCVHGP